MKKFNLKKIIDWLQYSVATITFIFLLITADGTYSVIAGFHLNIFSDWRLVWLPDAVNYFLLIVSIIFCVKRIRIGLVASFAYVIKDFNLYLALLFSSSVFAVDGLITYMSVILTYLLFFKNIAGLVLWSIELYQKWKN